jgi:hypothetical protein
MFFAYTVPVGRVAVWSVVTSQYYLYDMRYEILPTAE